MNRPLFRALRAVWRMTVVLVVFALAILLLRTGFKRYYTAVYPIQYKTEVLTASNEFGIKPSLIYAIIHTESSFDPQATSPANAKGLMQLTDDTFGWALKRAGDTNKYTADDLYTPSVNIHYGVYVLTLLGEQFEHTVTVLAAYNAGQGRVSDWLNDTRYSSDGVRLHTIPFEETNNYVKRVLQAQKRYQQLYSIE